MMEAFSTRSNKNRTFVLFAVCGVLVIAAAVVGIGDNPPGLLLAFLSASAFVVAFVHPWRTSKKFMRLIYASVLGFIVFAVLHNVFEGLASKAGESGFVHGLLGGVGAVFFLVAILLCPPGLLVGVVGAIVMYRRERRSQQGAPAA